MKKVITGLIVAIVVAWNVPAFAESASTTVQVVVTVPLQLNLIVTLYKVDQLYDANGNPIENDHPIQKDHMIGDVGAPGTMDFGTLQMNNKYGIWMGTYGYCFSLAAQTSGRPYNIQQTCYGVMSGTNSLNTALTMSPVYAPQDQYGFDPNASDPNDPKFQRPADSTLGNPTLSFGVNKNIYDSGSTGKTVSVQCHYGIFTDDKKYPVPGAAVLTSSQSAGTYTGKIMFTLSLK